MIENIWDSIAANPDAVKLTEIQRQELDSRLEPYKQNPAKVSTWDEVKQRI